MMNDGTTPSPRKFILLNLCAGLVLGSAVAWVVRHAVLPPAAVSTGQILARFRSMLADQPAGDFPRLLDALVLREDDDARRLREIAFTVWTERAAPAAVRWAATTPAHPPFDAETRLRMLRQAAVARARADLDATYAWTRSFDDQHTGVALAEAILVRLAADDPLHALSLARERGPDFVRSVQSELCHAWADHDAATAVRTLGPALLQARRDDPRLFQALASWLGDDARSAVPWILAQPPDAARPWDSLMRPAIYSVADDTAVLASVAAALRQHPDPALVAPHLSLVFAAWKVRDPATALVWIKTLPDALRHDLLNENIYASDSDSKNIAPTLSFALELPAGPVRDRKLADLLTHWIRLDPAAAQTWLLTHDEPSLAGFAAQAEAAVALFRTLAAADPASPSDAWRALPSDEIRASVFPLFAEHWTKRDPASAARWIADQSSAPRPGHSEALFRAGSKWFKKDPLAALSWAEGLNDPELRQTALESFERGSPYHAADSPDPAERAALLAQIHDPALRDRFLSQHLRQWMRSDRHAVRAWITTHDTLSPEQRALLLQE
jgi:hypothetical protein